MAFALSALRLFFVCQSLKSISPVTAGKLLGFKSKTSPFMRALINAECCKEAGPRSRVTSGSAFHAGPSSLSGFWSSSRHQDFKKGSVSLDGQGFRCLSDFLWLCSR